MKKTNLLTLALTVCIGFWSSCSKSDSHVDHCDECHIAMDNPNYDAADPSTGPHHFMWHMVDADGNEIEFCGEDLHDAEEVLTIPEGQYLVSESGFGDTLFAGTYTHGVDGYEIHCHED